MSTEWRPFTEGREYPLPETGARRLRRADFSEHYIEEVWNGEWWCHVKTMSYEEIFKNQTSFCEELKTI